MAKSRKFEIASTSYNLKSLSEKVKIIKSELEGGVVVTRDDLRFQFMIELYMRYYPFQEDKGVDPRSIRDLTVEKNENCQYRSQTFFWVMHDGEMINWQPKDCWSPKSQLTCVKQAFRMAISGQTYEHLESLIKEADGRQVICEVTGKPFRPEIAKSCEVDHEEPEFDIIFWSFIGKRSLDINSIELMRDNGFWLSDKQLEKDFQDFHRGKANLRVISKEGHRVKTYGTKSEKRYKFLEMNFLTGVACGQ